jgi:hypothetical protein
VELLFFKLKEDEKKTDEPFLFNIDTNQKIFSMFGAFLQNNQRKNLIPKIRNLIGIIYFPTECQKPCQTS